MKHNLHFLRLGLLLVSTLGVSSCMPAKPVAEADYGAKIVGNWLGTVGNMHDPRYMGHQWQDHYVEDYQCGR